MAQTVNLPAAERAYRQWTLPHVRRLLEEGKREQQRILFRRIFCLPTDGSEPDWESR